MHVSTRTRLAAAFAAAILITAASADAETFNACAKLANGKVIKITRGSMPPPTCSVTQTPVSWSNEQVIPSGETRSGYYSSAGVSPGGLVTTFVDYYFPQKAPSAPTVNFVGLSDPFTANCPFKGQAAPGFLCIYEMTDTNLTSRFFFSLSNPTQGFRVRANSLGAGPYEEAGVWAYTAP